jgi:hypothetical protein
VQNKTTNEDFFNKIKILIEEINNPLVEKDDITINFYNK